MNQANPYKAPRTVVADEPSTIAKRPVIVTIALALLWTLLTFAALGSLSHVQTLESATDPWSVAYLAYLAGMVLAPAFLLANIARARNWARIALLVLYLLNFMFRVFLFVNDGQFTFSIVAWLFIPAIIELIAFILLFLPSSGDWFGGRLNTSLERSYEP
jgi:hypothetical protein